jgi:hypothetical protein
MTTGLLDETIYSTTDSFFLLNPQTTPTGTSCWSTIRWSSSERAYPFIRTLNRIFELGITWSSRNNYLMDAFEQLVSEILWMGGDWVRTSVKVELTKEEKRLIGRRSSPRWEFDIVAYNGRDNLLRVVECKSYIDSIGVDCLPHPRYGLRSNAIA